MSKLKTAEKSTILLLAVLLVLLAVSFIPDGDGGRKQNNTKPLKSSLLNS